MFHSPTPTLLTPGPVQLEPSIIKSVLKGSHLHHRMPKFTELRERIEDLFFDAFSLPKNFEVLTLGCSGTGMVEAMLRNYKSLDKGKVLCLVNGHFGQRLANIAQKIQLDMEVIELEEGQNFMPSLALENILSAKKDIKAIALVHLETSVGHVNDLLAIAELCRQHKMDLLLDMVSSLGGEDFCFEKINPSMAVSTSGKALGSLPGLGIALLRKDIAEALVKNESHDHYFAFAEYLLARSQHRSTPFTPPVHLYPPLLRALQLIKEEGLKHKLDRHAAGISILENIAALHGFKPIGVESPSKTTRTFAYDPCDHSLFDDFKRHLLAFGFVPLQNPISQRSKGIFQLSSMGYLPVPLLRRLEQSIAGHSLIAL